MKSKSWRLGPALFMLVALIVTSCATPTAAPEAQPTEAPAEATTAPEPSGETIALTMWDIPESDAYTQWWEDYIDEFNTANPDIQVGLEVFDAEDFKQKIRAALVAGETGDIFYSIPGPDNIAAFREGKMLPLDEWIDPNLLTDATRASCTIDGQLACLPLYLAPSYIYYNKAMFADAGIDPASWADPTQPTWEEFLAACDALKAAGIVPIALGNADNWPGMFWYWAAQNRYGGVTDLNNAITGENGGSYQAESFLKAGELVQNLDQSGYLPDGYNGIAGDQKYAVFTQGEGAMIYQGPWLIGTIEATAPEGFEYGFFNFPKFADGDPDSQTDLMSGVDALWISANGAHPEAAGQFLSGFVELENASDFMLTTNNISSVKGVAESVAADNGDNTVVQLTLDSGKAQHVYFWWDWALPPNVAEEMLNQSQGLFLGEVTPEDYAARLDEVAGR